MLYDTVPSSVRCIVYLIHTIPSALTTIKSSSYHHYHQAGRRLIASHLAHLPRIQNTLPLLLHNRAGFLPAHPLLHNRTMCVIFSSFWNTKNTVPLIPIFWCNFVTYLFFYFLNLFFLKAAIFSFFNPKINKKPSFLSKLTPLQTQNSLRNSLRTHWKLTEK